jgi:hypothetical protein
VTVLQTERLRITLAGLYLWGLACPSTDLDVLKLQQRLRITSAGLVGELGGTGNATLRFDYEGSTNRASIGVLASDQKLTFGTAGSTAMTIDASQRVGIGTTSPSTLLHVNTGANATAITVAASTATSGQLLIGTGAKVSGQQSIVSSGNGLDIATLFGVPITFYTSDTERARIDSSGRLGIGTSTPVSGAQLTVAGAALAVTGQNLDHSANSIRIGQEGSGAAQIRCYGPNTSTNGSLTFKMSRSDGTNSQDVVIDGSGRLGIGTTSPSSYNVAADDLVVAGSGNTGITIAAGSSSYSSVYFADGTTGSEPYRGIVAYNHTSDELVFYTAGLLRSTIDSSGRLLVGTSSAVTGGTAQFSRIVALGNSAGATNPGVISIGMGDNAAGEYAEIAAQCDGTPGSGDYPGRLVFSTTADGASSPTERARITNAGYFKATSTGDYYGVTSGYHESRTGLANNVSHLFSHSASTGAVYGIQISYAQNKGTSTGDQYIYCNDSAAVRMEVRGNGGIANYSGNNVNLSDRNAKKDISPASDTWDCIKEWEIVNYRYKDQPDDADLNLGVVAQQVAESCPEVITVFQEAKEATEDQPAQEERLGVKEQQMYWMAIKALQEAQVRIEQLEQRLTDAGIA